VDELREREPEVNKLFRLARKIQASDFYVEAGSAPAMRVDNVTKIIDMQPLSQQDLEHLLSPLLFAEQQTVIAQGGQVAFTYACEEGKPYRVRVSNSGGRLRLSAHHDD
jgi:Tfp pilus assembly pilus retraction ATPase PilT